MPEAADETAAASAPAAGRTAAFVPEAEAAEVERFRQVRRARRSELIDDYVEMIAELGEEVGEARQTDIATRLGVSQPTVAKMLKRLVESGHVVQRPYRGVFLTPEGKARALASRTRHDLVERFLVSIGVSPATARLDAEGIEHHVSEETLAAFAATIRRRTRRA